jgi:DNA processing protein
MNHQTRAALVAMGQDMTRAREVLAATERRSLELVFRNEFQVTSARKSPPKPAPQKKPEDAIAQINRVAEIAGRFVSLQCGGQKARLDNFHVHGMLLIPPGEGSLDGVGELATLWNKKAFGPISDPIDAALEIGAYEALWTEHNASFKSLAERFASFPGARPSDLVPEKEAREFADRVLKKLRRRVQSRFDVRVHGELDYPARLRDATHPVELLYFQGRWELLANRAVAVVGTRKPTTEGLKRTQQLVRKLASDGFTIVSGLAEGVDTAAHTTAIEQGGDTIAVIGTPLGHSYPKSNAELQSSIAQDFLLISQVPIERYEAQNYRVNRFFFPERNKTMSALTEATVIVEAGETSGTLVQAREALKQKRKLFILSSCFERGDLTWPHRFEQEGAIRVRDYDDIRRELVK